MTHSLRTLFRFMLLAWFVLVLVMAAALKVHLPSETAGTLVENLLPRPSAPPPAPVLQKEAPQRPRPVVTPEPRKEAPRPRPIVITPDPTPEHDPSLWRKLEHGHGSGTGSLGVPEIAELPDGSIELLFPFHGTPGEITFYRSNEKGSLSVDLQGELRLQHVVERMLTRGFLHRLQVYPHPGFIRISGKGRTRDLLRNMDAAAFASEDRLRVVFTLDEARRQAAAPRQPNNQSDKLDDKDMSDAPAAPL